MPVLGPFISRFRRSSQETAGSSLGEHSIQRRLGA
jgi:hypothetical protein